MIRKPNNWDNVQEMSDRAKLPVGAYVCRVKQVNVMRMESGEQLVILYDIAEGEHKDFFARDFQTSTMQDKKWKGVFRQWLPKDDGSDRDETTKRILKGMITAFENSNPGYVWNWDETSLIGKTVGILFREEEWEWQGKRGWSVKPFRAMTASKVRNGEYTIPEKRPLRGDAADVGINVQAPSSYTVVETDELPF